MQKDFANVDVSAFYRKPRLTAGNLALLGVSLVCWVAVAILVYRPL